MAGKEANPVLSVSFPASELREEADFPGCPACAPPVGQSPAAKTRRCQSVPKHRDLGVQNRTLGQGLTDVIQCCAVSRCRRSFWGCVRVGAKMLEFSFLFFF